MNPWGISSRPTYPLPLWRTWNTEIRRSIEEYHRFPFADERHSPTPKRKPKVKSTTCARRTCDRGPWRRGLCTTHYRHYLRTREAA